MSTLVAERAFCVMTLAPLIAFITQMALIIYFSQENQTDYSEKALCITVLIYQILLGTVFMLISYYYDGDTFLFSKVDAMFYFRESMKASGMGLFKGINYLTSTFKSDDWGALVFDSTSRHVYSSREAVLEYNQYNTWTTFCLISI